MPGRSTSPFAEMKAFTAPRKKKKYHKVRATESSQLHSDEEDDDGVLISPSTPPSTSSSSSSFKPHRAGDLRPEADSDAALSIIELQSPTTAAHDTPVLPSSSHPPPDETDESQQVESMVGLQYSLGREVAYYLLSLFTLTLSALLAFWFPVYAARHRYRPSSLSTAHFVLVLTRNGQHEFCPVERISAFPASQRPALLARYHSPPPPLDPSEKMIVFRHSRYVYDPPSSSFLRLAAPHTLPYSAIAAALSRGTSASSAAASYALHGPNAIDIPIPSVPSLLVREVLHPFFVFQIYSIVLWCFEAYFVFAGCILVIATVSIVTTLVETRRRLFALRELAHFTSPVTALRDGRWVTMDSSALTPGDVVQLTTGVVPCDVALLSGACVVNEAMLTGESLPILKSPVDLSGKAATAAIALFSPSHLLFSATTTLQLKPDPHAGHGCVVGMVVKTGWATTKGALILSILYPAPSSFRFVEQSFKFIGALFAVSVVGFFISIAQLSHLGVGVGVMVVRGLDLITIIIPPSLPLALSVGTNYALVALRRRKIHCISPAKINVAGKVRVMAFDKTGTLTSEGMEMKGVRPVTDGDFTEFVSRILPTPSPAPSDEETGGKKETRLRVLDSESDDALALSPAALPPAQVEAVLHTALACCHSLALMEGELIGDPLEVQIFRSTGAAIIDTSASTDGSATSSTSIRIPSPIGPRVVGLVHGYEFQSALQRMTVIARDEEGQHFVFTKGAPEVIQGLCLPASVPSSFTATFAGYAKHGYRIIAIAYKPVGKDVLLEDREAVRPSLERDLRMLGLIVLENAVKDETAPTLAVLQAARVRCVMVTGDYPVTAISVAKECGLVAAGVRVYQGRLKSGEVEWRDSDDDSLALDPLTLRPTSAAPHPYELAMTGDVFRHLTSSSTPIEAFHRILLSTVVFARMTPDQKALMVTSLQSLKLYTGMCGDGANDTGSLKAAHAGISLSTSEASIAAPFTFLEPNIRCVPMLLSQGRSALQTSFSLFKFIAMYSLIQFGAAILCYFVGSVLGNWQYLYQDMFVVFILTLLMGGIQAVDSLSIKRPSGDLLSLTNVVSVFTHMALCLAFQIAVFSAVSTQSGYIAYQDAPGFSNGPATMETTSLYYFSNFQYLLYAVLFARGHPWKRPVYTNLRFSAWGVVVLVANLCLLFSEPVVGFWRDDDVSLPMGWRWGILGFVLAQLVCSCLWEFVLLPRVGRWWRGRRMRRGGGQVGEVYGHVKRISGSGVKEYHRLRGEFERGWKGARAAMEDD